MATPPTPDTPPVDPRRLSFNTLLALVVVGVVLCALIAAPLLSALTWAFALAVVAMPFHERVEARMKRPNLAAGFSVLAVTLLLFVPAGLVAWQVGVQAQEYLGELQSRVDSGALRDLASRLPGGTRIYDAILRGETPTETIVPRVQQAGGWVASAGAVVFQTVVALFSLFFLLRDRAVIARTARHYLPLTRAEANQFLERIRSVTHATLFGTGVTSMIQGILGGIIFALLGIPGALLWGVVMALLSLIPSSGAFVIWLPAALILAMRGDWGKAAILGGWGALVVGTIDNVLYPWLVGKEVQMHTLTIFIAVVGGLIVFGAPGLVLGPLIIAATMAMLDIVRRRGRARKARPI